MAEIDEQMNRGWRALLDGKDIGWDRAAENSAHIMYPEASSPDEHEARFTKIEYVGDFIRKVLSVPLEPVVFYRPGATQEVADDRFYIFSVVTPDPEKPVDFMGSKDTEERNAVIKLKPIAKDIGTIAKHSVSSSYDISVNATPDSNIKVWFGAGTQDSNISPDKAYDERSNGTQVAVGSQEVGELFSSLRSDDSIRNGRLFGGLFKIAWHANLLGTKPANLGAFEEEKFAAIEAVNVRRSATKSLLTGSTQIYQLLEEASVKAAERSDAIKGARTMYHGSLGDVYIEPLYQSRDISEEVLDASPHRFDSLARFVQQQQTSSQRLVQAIEADDLQLTILSSMVND